MSGLAVIDADIPYCRAIFESMPSGIVVQDEGGRIVSANRAAQSILGLSLDQMRGVTCVDPLWRTIHEDGSDFPGSDHPVMEVLRTGQPVRSVVMGVFNPKTGSYNWIQVSAEPLRDEGVPAIQGVFAMFEDITRKKAVETSLREKDAEFRIAIQASSDGFWVADMQGQLLDVNDAYAGLSGYSREELLQMSIADLDSFERPQDVAARMQRIVQNGHERFAVVHRAKDGRRWPAEVVASYSPVGGGRFFCFIKDLTEQQHSVELIWHQANFDRLTDLPNRALFFDRLSQECVAARRNGKRVALLFADLDAFKAVNDQFGHDAGDVVLQTTAARWLSCVRGTDTIARLGGDEFAIILGNLDSEQEASAIAGKIIATLQQPIDLGDAQSCSVGVSIGIAMYPDNALEMDSLLQTADKAMYACKTSGKNAFAFSDKQIGKEQNQADWIVFHDSFLIGVAAIDEQHRQLVRMVNDLNQDIASGMHDAAHIALCFDKLISFTLLHFQTEHRLMASNHYPDARAHDHEHGQLISELRLIAQKSSQDGDLLVLQRIKDWLLNHMQTADKALGRYLNQQGVQ